MAAFVDAVNAQNMAGIVECFHPDVRLTSVPYYGEGLATVRYWANCLVNRQMTVGITQNYVARPAKPSLALRAESMDHSSA